MYYRVVSINLGVVFFVLLVFGLLQWLQIPTGSFLDWVIALAIFEWLLVIVTIPWNIYFSAQEVLVEATLSREQGIGVESKQIQYAKNVAKISFWLALTLHLLSAVALYALALSGIGVLGYIGSGAALLLTLLRPALRTYQYLAFRLATIKEQIQYPRQDVVALRHRVQELESVLEALQSQMNPDNPSSYVAGQQQYQTALQQQLTTLGAQLQTWRSQNEADHERLGQESRQAIAQLTTDGQFLEHVREIIRFFKSA